MVYVVYKDGTNDTIASPDVNFQSLGKLIDLMIKRFATNQLSIVRNNKEVDYIIFKFYALVNPEKEPLICNSKVVYQISIKTIDEKMVWSTNNEEKKTYVLISDAKFPIFEYKITADELSQRINYMPGAYNLIVDCIFFINTDTATYRAQTNATVGFERLSVQAQVTSTPTITAVSSSATSSDAWEVVQKTQPSDYTAYVVAQHKAEVEAISYGKSTTTGYTMEYYNNQPIIRDPAGNMHVYGYRELLDGTKVYPYTVDEQGRLVANPQYFYG